MNTGQPNTLKLQRICMGLYEPEKISKGDKPLSCFGVRFQSYAACERANDHTSIFV